MMSQKSLQADDLQLKFLIFPIFLAGFASNRGEDKVLALEVLRDVEKTSATRDATTIRQLLQIVYQRQEQSMRRLGSPWAVDWKSVMQESSRRR
jgi:hypothetical protein